MKLENLPFPQFTHKPRSSDGREFAVKYQDVPLIRLIDIRTVSFQQRQIGGQERVKENLRIPAAEVLGVLDVTTLVFVYISSIDNAERVHLVLVFVPY